MKNESDLAGKCEQNKQLKVNAITPNASSNVPEPRPFTMGDTIGTIGFLHVV